MVVIFNVKLAVGSETDWRKESSASRQVTNHPRFETIFAASPWKAAAIWTGTKRWIEASQNQFSRLISKVLVPLIDLNYNFFFIPGIVLPIHATEIKIHMEVKDP